MMIAILLVISAAFYHATFQPWKEQRALGKTRMQAARFTARRAGLIGAALGIIVGIEAVLPSHSVTGKPLPQRQEVPRPLDAVPWTQTPLTFADVAALSPAFWPLGKISRADVIARIDADLALLENRLANRPQRASAAMVMGLESSSEAGITALMDALGTVRSTILAEDEDNDIPAAQVDTLMSGAFNEAFEAYQAEVVTRTEELTRRIDEIQAAAGDEAITDPTYRTLLSERSNLRLSQTTASLFLSTFGRTMTPKASLFTIRDDQARFPSFDRPFVISDYRYFRPATGTIMGPAPAANPFGSLGLKLRDAVVGYTRARSRYAHAQRCGLVIADSDAGPVWRQICDVSVPLNINYDMTGLKCTQTGAPMGSNAQLAEAGTRRAKDACKESWIYPNLTVQIENGKFTVHAPRPVAVEGGTVGPDAPLSLWYATWEGVKKPLSPTASFAWNGEINILQNLVLHHDVQPQVTFAQRWSEYRGSPKESTASLALMRASAKQAGSFQPVEISDMRLDKIIPLGQSFATLGSKTGMAPVGTPEQLSELERALAAQHPVITRAAGLRRAGDPNAQTCGFLSLQYYFGRSSNDQTGNNRIGDTSSLPTCAHMQAYSAVLNSLQRALSEGSWLWLIERKGWLRDKDD